MEPKGSFEEYQKSFPITHAAIMTLFDEILHPGDVFSKYPDTTKIYDMFAMHIRINSTSRAFFDTQSILYTKKRRILCRFRFWDWLIQKLTDILIKIEI